MSDAGPRTPLVLLHGLGQSPMAWEDVVVPLYPTRRLLSPWVPGLKPTDTRSVPIADAAAALDTDLMLEGMERVDLCGLSFGAMVATRLAADFPERMRRLVLIAGQVRVPRAVLRLQSGLLRMTPDSRLAASGLTRGALRRALDLVRDTDLTDALPRVTAPTLVLVGSKDRANRSAARALAAGISGAVLREVPGAGHQVNVEQPRELVTILREFLDHRGGPS